MLAGLTLVNMLIIIVIVMACIAIVKVVLPAMGINLPPWFEQILLIVCIAAVAIIAIKIVAGLF